MLSNAFFSDKIFSFSDRFSVLVLFNKNNKNVRNNNFVSSSYEILYEIRKRADIQWIMENAGRI